MDQLFTIGEFSKIKGMSTKCLRYFDKLGVFRPAYTNPETGYRYYSYGQLRSVDMIMSCLALKIPLKNFHNYMVDQNQVDIDQLLADGNQAIEEQMRKLRAMEDHFAGISNHIARTRHLKNQPTSFSEVLPLRHVLIHPCDTLFPAGKDLCANLKPLHLQCYTRGYADTFDQGILYQEGQPFAFLSIPPYLSHMEHSMAIPEAMFQCQVVDAQNLASVVTPLLDTGKLVICKELSDFTLYNDQTQYEVQVSDMNFPQSV